MPTEKEILHQIVDELRALSFKAEKVCDEHMEPLASIDAAYKQAKFRLENPSYFYNQAKANLMKGPRG